MRHETMTAPTASSSPWRAAFARWLPSLLPWLPFALLLGWGWRSWDLVGTLPVYGDVLELIWITEWAAATLLSGQGEFSFHPHLFFPEGWHVGSFSQGPGVWLLLLAVAQLGGPAFAFNLLTLASFVVAFAGMRRFGLRFLSPFAATLAALLFTFWGFRWLRVYGHLNILLGTALLPWFLWAVERAMEPGRRAWRWLVLAGALWALAVSFALYFIWLGALLLGGWLAGRVWGRALEWRRAGAALAVASLVAALGSAPVIWTFMQGQRAAQAGFYGLEHINNWGASLNALPLPSVYHPWLGPLAQRLFTGNLTEANTANMGLVASCVALLALWPALRAPAWRPFLVLAALGFVLALGLTVQHNGFSFQFASMEPLNRLLWPIGSLVKPHLFPPGPVPPPFERGVPLPGLLLAALVPFWEGARVLSRYTFLASLGFFPLVAWWVGRVPTGWLRWAIAGLLVVEIVPPPIAHLPFPPAPHPAYEWLAQQQLDGEAIADLHGGIPGHLGLARGGEVVWATTVHGQPTVSGAGSVTPAHTARLEIWLWMHPHPFQQPDWVPLLREFRVRWVFLHMTSANEQGHLAEAAQNPALRLLRCFPPPTTATAWPRDICVVEVLP